ncbi:replication termination factor 2 [Culicoides brevitarsis]|uniref:replication termination factor 2 n=1 Tax=Culicoides brevitarsis TaxID=469753 RepID=UPI00307C1FF5
MGCDGGTIPRRDELVRTAKKPEQKDKDAERVFRWKHCALTQQKLQQPIVMDGLGRLYTKQNVIESLLEKELPADFQHIKSLKDIKDLNLTPNPAFNAEANANETSNDVRNAPFICSLIGLEMSGKFRFVGLWTCGCVMSERALKEIKANSCPMCQIPFREDDVVVLNGTEEDMDLMRVRMEARVARIKAEKKAKSEKKIKTEVKQEPGTPSSSSGVKEEKAGTSKITKLSIAPPVLKGLKREIISDKLGADPRAKKVKADYSVNKDSQASEVYKSIFTSHKTEKEQQRAHWVTYNPFYN